MGNMRRKILTMLNKTFELKYADSVQYFTHAEHSQGPNTETFIERLQEIASALERAFKRKGKRTGRPKLHVLYYNIYSNNCLLMRNESGKMTAGVAENLVKLKEA